MKLLRLNPETQTVIWSGGRSPAAFHSLKTSPCGETEHRLLNVFCQWTETNMAQEENRLLYSSTYDNHPATASTTVPLCLQGYSLKKGIYLLCIKYPHFLPPECICVLSGIVYMEPDERSVYVVCHQGMAKWSSTVVVWKRVLEIHKRSRTVQIQTRRRTPVLNHFLSAILRTKGFSCIRCILHVAVWEREEPSFMERFPFLQVSLKTKPTGPNDSWWLDYTQSTVLILCMF